MYYLKLFSIYFEISLASFGGIFSIWALIQDIVVRRCSKFALNDCNAVTSQFEQAVALSNLLPGPKVAGLTLLGFDQGIVAMIVLLIALILPGLLIIPALAWFTRKYHANEWMGAFKRGARLASVSVLLLFAYVLMVRLWGKDAAVSAAYLAVAALTFFLSYRFRMNPLALVLAAGLAGYFLG